jgi:EAL domain-containing protein (putative c-di-GMP-specific phosphodiesterase class I)
VMPGEFIPVAEETDLILRIGEWVLKTACAQGLAWQQAGLPPLRMASNISSQQVRKPELVDLVQATLDESGFDPAQLELEITESALIGDDPGVVDTLKRVKRLGVRLALDDFGTGYSSLSHLVRFPIDTLKIDQSFVQRVGIERQTDAIIAAVVAMAHRLKLAVIAEGVETWEQEQFLRSEGCDEFQGYLFSHPVEVDALVALLRPEKTKAFGPS